MEIALRHSQHLSISTRIGSRCNAPNGVEADELAGREVYPLDRVAITLTNFISSGTFRGKQRAIMQYMCMAKMRSGWLIQWLGAKEQVMSKEVNSVQPALLANLGNQQW